MGAGDDYLRLSDRELFDQCRFERFRASGRADSTATRRIQGCG